MSSRQARVSRIPKMPIVSLKESLLSDHSLSYSWDFDELLACFKTIFPTVLSKVLGIILKILIYSPIRPSLIQLYAGFSDLTISFF